MPKPDRTPLPRPTPEQTQTLNSLAHRVQSGIASLQSLAEQRGTRFPQTEPKHLRVGINSALVETSALARLMFRKGLITAEEYFDALIECWEQEVDSYRAELKQIDPRLDI